MYKRQIEDPAWAEEIQKAVDGTGPAVYIKIDCIMMAYDDTTGKADGPFLNVPGYGGSDGNLQVGVTEDGYSMSQIFNVNNGLLSHFNRYLLIGNGTIEIQQDNEDDEFVAYDYTMDKYANIDANQPAFAMSNFSSEFDLSKGIPSSEYITNTFLADSWYGNTNVYARIVSKHYTHPITYRWKIDSGYWTYIDTDNDGINETPWWEYDIDTYSETVNLDIGTAYVAFQYLSDTHIYDFTNADIANGAYDGDHIYYDDTHEVPITCIGTKDYKDVATHGPLITEEPLWKATTSDHVSLGTFTYKNSVDLGLVSQKPDLDAQKKNDIDAIRKIISANTRTRNDKLVIDGHTFMSNETVTGCNFVDEQNPVPTTYKLCTNSAAWVHDYLQQTGTKPLHAYDPADVTGSVSVQIPPTVDNGYYETSMKVYYQRLATYSKTAIQFSAD